MKLSAQQDDAVRHIGSPALVVAGAGSGKTRTLTAKISFLIDKGFDPSRLLAITFTNKAAGEMKTRLVKQTRLPQEKFPWVRTYHSACFTILKIHAGLLGYKSPLQIFSAYHQQKTFKEIAAAMNFDKKVVPSLMSDISKAKNSGDPEGYIQDLSLIKRSMTLNVYKAYENELKQKNALDFDNILLQARNLLRDHDTVRRYYRDLFQFILVDEYQDTNNIQEEITGLLLGHTNLFCVGDDWQAVYGFRGSNVNHFLSFPEKYADAKIFRLEQNYRSADEIVQVANLLIGNNAHRMKKTCFSEKNGGLVDIHEFPNEFEEALWVARKIRSMRGMGLPFSSMAVMYRTKSCSLWFEKTFRKMDIPYTMMGSKGFFERKEVLDINCYLLSAFFPDDDVAFERIINTPKRGIGPSILKKIAQARTQGTSLQNAARILVKERVLTTKVHTELTRLLDSLDLYRTMEPDQVIYDVLSTFKYMDHLSDYCKTREEFDSRKDNIDELIYNASLKKSLEEYLEEIVLINEDKDDDTDKRGVRLSTVHASKGLEYTLAFVVGLEEELFPHWRSLMSASEIEEERRLMYVAVTRAENYLYITSAQERRNKKTRKSRFLLELRDALDSLE
ncbi:MAG: ATP-dependent helicase [Proteobacteria bacterium]|nr:ATP-dependent helicase [Pseudomonadota bacterium]